MSVAIFVGIPHPLRPLVERHVGRRILVRVIPMKRDGGFKLESPPPHAATLLEVYADTQASYSDVLVVLLPYAQIPKEVTDSADILEQLGARVIRPTPGSANAHGPCKWPPRAPRLDKEFQDSLFDAIRNILDSEYPEEAEVDGDIDIACDMIRGLAVHSKMGPNNHSHEDDLWKGCGQNLPPGEKSRIVKWLTGEGILDCKKNKSMGGTGWVYWIADVEKAKTMFPGLIPYFA